jgi:hypothetical protein
MVVVDWVASMLADIVFAGLSFYDCSLTPAGQFGTTRFIQSASAALFHETRMKSLYL